MNIRLDDLQTKGYFIYQDTDSFCFGIDAVLLSSFAAKGDPFYAVSLGWSQNTSGQRQLTGFEQKFAEYGITNYEIVTAEYDAVLQSDQIRALIAKSPKAMFITPSFNIFE